MPCVRLATCVGPPPDLTHSAIASLVSAPSQPNSPPSDTHRPIASRSIAPWPGSLAGASAATPIVVVGGTFDPPHRAHVNLPRLVRERERPGAVLLFVPAATSPFKQGVAATPATHRAAMLALATRDVPNTGVWLDEIERAGDGSASFTIDTVQRLRTLRPQAPITLLIGADQAAAFHRWKSARDILKIASALIVLREPFGSEGALLHELQRAAFWTDDELAMWKRSITRTPLDAVSATSVRERICAHGVESAADLLAPAVLEYIRQNNLYQSPR